MAANPMKSTKVLNPRRCISIYSYLILNSGLEIENGLLVTTCKIVLRVLMHGQKNYALSERVMRVMGTSV